MYIACIVIPYIRFDIPDWLAIDDSALEPLVPKTLNIKPLLIDLQCLCAMDELLFVESVIWLS